MSRVFLTDNFKNIPTDQLRGMMELVLQELQDQINAGPAIASLTSRNAKLPVGMRSGDVVFNISGGELQAGVYNGVEVLYAAFGSFSGSITDSQHGDRAGGTLHEVATTALAGFMSAADKTKSDHYKGMIFATVPVSLTDLPSAGDWCHYNDSVANTFQIAVNFAGTIKVVALA